MNFKYRFEGYKEALKTNNLPFEEALVKNVSLEDAENQTLQVVEELLQMDNPVDTIYFSNNQSAYLGIKHIRERKNKEWDQVSICSFDSYFFMDLLGIPMVYGTQPIELLGQNVVKLAMKQIDSDVLINEKIVLPIAVSEIKFS